MKVSLILVLVLAIAVACASQRDAADRAGAKEGASATAPRSLLPSMRSDVRQACLRVAVLMRSSGARRVVNRDTLVDPSTYSPREMACVVQVDSFATVPRADLLRALLADSGWAWHPFEPVDNEAYGIVRDSVQCEVIPHPPLGERDSAVHAARLHVLCYPD